MNEYRNKFAIYNNAYHSHCLIKGIPERLDNQAVYDFNGSHGYIGEAIDISSTFTKGEAVLDIVPYMHLWLISHDLQVAIQYEMNILYVVIKAHGDRPTTKGDVYSSTTRVMMYAKKHWFGTGFCKYIGHSTETITNEDGSTYSFVWKDESDLYTEDEWMNNKDKHDRIFIYSKWGRGSRDLVWQDKYLLNEYTWSNLSNKLKNYIYTAYTRFFEEVSPEFINPQYRIGSVIGYLVPNVTKTYTNTTWNTSKTWYIKTTFTDNATESTSSNVVNYVTSILKHFSKTYYRYEATYRVAGFILLKSIIINKKTRGRLMPTSNLFSL